MRGQTDVVDAPGSLLGTHVLDERAVHDLLELGNRVYEVDQPQLDMPAEASEQLLPCRDHRIHVARASVLAVLPSGAEVTLHDPLVAVRADGIAQNPAHRRVGHPAIHDVDSLLRSEIHQTGDLLLIIARHPLRAETDLADLKPRPAQMPILHGTPSLLDTVPVSYQEQPHNRQEHPQAYVDGTAAPTPTPQEQTLQLRKTRGLMPSKGNGISLLDSTRARPACRRIG